MNRLHRDEYYMRIAHSVSLRGTCDRRQVGAVIVCDDTILSTGFNGAPRGLPSCDEAGHLMVNGHCVRTIHAEANALLAIGAPRLRAAAATAKGCPCNEDRPFSARDMRMMVTLYTTTWPCMWCMKQAIQCGVGRIVYGQEYRDETHNEDGMAYAREVSNMLAVIIDPLPLDFIA